MSNHGIEVAREYEAPYVPHEQVNRQLGRVSLEGFMLAPPIETENNPLNKLGADLNHAIVGQPDAIESIITALGREELRNPERPVANLLFLGPTGVGKSETAKELARQLHKDDEEGENFLKIDCSLFSHGHEVIALLGAPPSYVGRDQKPWFDPDIIERDDSVVLFDEVEKGSQPLWDLMLQIMEDGEVKLTGTGNVVSFKNSIIIMTSNLGSQEISTLLETKQTGFQSARRPDEAKSKEQINNAATKALKLHFRPEFINRFDERVVFGSLDDEQMGEVLNRYLDKANERYKQKRGVQLAISPELREQMVTSTDERHEFGPRPILRKFERIVESDLSMRVRMGSIPEASHVYVDMADEVVDLNSEDSEKIQFYYKTDSQLQEFLENSRRVVEEPEEEEEDDEPVVSTELVPVE
ncbi:MAG TPA: AAA family ATPase [Candidatus Saccharimonadales bacterium]|nr:AAA family ATPase [Candidatus Saccharimonadales bacterium]